MMENTLYYFFSTLAQSFAALTAFVFTSAQFRISWLDQKITSSKKSLLYSMYGHSPYVGDRVDFFMNKMTATEVIEDANSKDKDKFKYQSSKLKKLILQMQEMRSDIRKFVLYGMVITGLGIIGIPFSRLLSSYEIGANVLMGVLSCLSILSLGFMGKFIYFSLLVSTKNEIE